LKDNDYILEMDGIGKVFPGVKALDGVNFKVKRGEIHCLVGENGAGKSTLMKVLSGVYPTGTYTGRIILNSSEQHYKDISDSEKAGIAIIYQELALIPELTIHENIFFGHELKKGQFIDWNETVVKAKETLKKIGMNINPETKVKDLGVGVQQLVEICKALSKDVKLLILDEPTAALSEVDCDKLLQILRDLKKQGVTCIMISHKLREVISIADTITVLRDGKTIASIDATERKVEESEIIKHMVGREIEDVYPKRKDVKFGDVFFELKNWTAFDPNKGREILHNIDFNVRKGEIVGIAGLMGAGRTEMALSIFGNTKHYDIKGELYVDGVKKNLNFSEKAIKEKIAYVTEDRKGNGLVLIQDIKFNTTFSNLKQLVKGLFIDENEEVNVANKFFDEVKIKAHSIEQVVGTLSGGNQQKVSLAKWLFAEPNLLILDEPTRGIDVGAKFEIYTIMNELVKRGMSIIMISSELPEILGMSDRIYVMSEGTMTGVIDAKDATEEKIMEMATA
jgi:putative multiple sugar transport system ATP-binding protein